MTKKPFYKLLCECKELQLQGTLNGGQSFRWKKIDKTANVEWIGIFARKVWILQQEEHHISYQVFETESDTPVASRNEDYYNQLLKNYFRLDVDLTKNYLHWSERDEHFKESAKEFYGIRILNQDITENIFSFICSQNNHISRISKMVNNLAEFYGEKICEIEGTSYYSFPQVEALANETIEKTLRENGFGYRAKYIHDSAKFIVNSGSKMWLDELAAMNYEDAKHTLMKLKGIGPKVADCICLMSLGHLQAIPVDTHIYQIAAKYYMPKLAKQKTVTEKIYKEIGDHFRELYGPLAGWAHTVLFCSDLKILKENDEMLPKKKKQRTK